MKAALTVLDKEFLRPHVPIRVSVCRGVHSEENVRHLSQTPARRHSTKLKPPEKLQVPRSVARQRRWGTDLRRQIKAWSDATDHKKSCV